MSFTPCRITVSHGLAFFCTSLPALSKLVFWAIMIHIEFTLLILIEGIVPAFQNNQLEVMD